MNPLPSPRPSKRQHLSWLVMGLVLALLAAGCTTSQPDTSPPLPVLTTPQAIPQSEQQPTPVSPAPASPAPAQEAIPEPAQVAAPFQPDQIRLTFTPFITGLYQPVFVTHAGDGSGRLFVVERRGLIWGYADGAPTTQSFLDIRDRINSGGQEQGLLGLAFDPQFAQNGAFFVNYTNKQGNTTLSRFQILADDPNVAEAASEQILLTIDQPASNHNGGMLAFGPDGMLYMGTGDGGAADDRYGNGQNPTTLLGKMLRLDVTSEPGTYRIPADNPWVDQSWNGQAVRDEVWAIGLRNPWRYSFDRLTGDLWIGDVGQNVYEEVDFVAAGTPGGLNFGWPIMEGLHCFPDSAPCDPADLEIPVIDYRHGADGCSITGGYVYRGTQFPALTGVYLYSDYCSGNIWAIAPADSAGGGWQNSLLAKGQGTVSSFGEDESGELYLTDLNKGIIYKLGVE